MLKSKKNLKYLLGITNNNLFKQNYVASLVEPYIDLTRKPRLIEPPKQELKVIQKRIKSLLGRIVVPSNIFSGIKGRSYVDNARFHLGDNLRNVFKIDLTAFFPSISRETVYSFFHKELCCSPDIACILTNFTTINLQHSVGKNLDKVYNFLNDKGIKCYNHLMSGSPTSQILSYLVNQNMFDELHKYAVSNNIIMTIYVDDVIFSSEQKISNYFIKHIYKIIKKYNYKLSTKKVKLYTKTYPKLITGVIINSSGNLTVKNSIRHRIIKEYNYLKENPDDVKSRQRLKGLITAARQVDKYIYPNIYKYAFDKLKHQ